MLPVRIELRNFLAYRAPVSISFEGLNLACLSGPNGAGKSSLLDAVTWALWGSARAKTDDELIHMGQDETSVQFDFRQDETLYRVIRKRSKKGRGQSSLYLYMWDVEENRWSDHIGGDTIRETQNRLTQLLHLDYDTFVHSAFLQQGNADAFTVATPGKRKDILADILGLSRWDHYEKQAKELLRRIEEEHQVIKLRIAEIEEDERHEPELHHELETAQHQAEQAKQHLEVAELAHAEVAGAPAAMQAAQTQLASLQRQIRSHEQDIAALTSELAREHKRITDYQKIVNSRDTIETGFAQLESTRQALEEMSDKLAQQDTLKDHLNDLRRQLDAMRADLEGQAGIYDSRIREAEQTIAASESLVTELDTLTGQLGQLEMRKFEREKIQQERENLRNEKTELDTRNKALHSEMNNIKERLGMVEAADGAVCPVCKQPLDESHVERLVTEYKAEGKTFGDTYRANIARIKEIAQIVAERETELKQIELDLREYDDLKGRQGMLTERLEALQQTQYKLGIDRAALEDIQRTIEADDFGLELREQINLLQAEIDSLGYDRDTHSEAREAIKSLRGFETQMRDLEIAVQTLPDIERRVQDFEARQERLNEQWQESCVEADTLKAEIETLTAVAQEAQRRQSEVNRLKMLERNAMEKLISIQQQLSAIDAARKRKQDLQNRYEMLLEEHIIYDQLREAFSKNGIPAMVIEAAIPELEESTNRLLARMTDGRMHVRFDTQRENKTGGVRETLDIMISDELGTRSYGMFSGGEGFRVNFALRIALSQFLARRAGARLQTLVIDEGFGSQDDVGRERLIEAINAIRNDFDLILIVTHIDDLRDAFPVHIEVRKTRDGATVAIM